MGSEGADISGNPDTRDVSRWHLHQRRGFNISELLAEKRGRHSQRAVQVVYNLVQESIRAIVRCTDKDSVGLGLSYTNTTSYYVCVLTTDELPGDPFCW